MLLRNHPRMSFHHVPNWPPYWIRVDELARSPFQGDAIGVLTQARMNNLNDPKIVLRMNDGAIDWLSILVFDDQQFCLRVHEILMHHVGKLVSEIGNLELD